jgi:hypothetical protein
MKYLEALVLLVSLGLIFATLVTPLNRPQNPSRLRGAAYAHCAGAAVLISSIYLLLTPSEEKTVWGENVSQQYIILGESDGYRYQRALVMTPALLPLPSVAGVLSAVAPEGAQLDSRWVDGKLHVSAFLHNGAAVSLACANRHVLGIELVTEPEVSPCPTR